MVKLFEAGAYLVDGKLVPEQEAANTAKEEVKKNMKMRTWDCLYIS